MEIWSEIRREVLTGALSKRAAIAKYGVGWHTLKKMLAHDEPPGYRQAKHRPKPKLEPFLPVIRQIVEDDGKAPTKQKHTARRIFERLRDEYGYTGGETVVQDAVREWRISYDNSAIAVIEVLKGRERKLTREFLRLQSHYLFTEHFCLVRRANEKGHVERLLGTARKRFLVAVPDVESIETLNRNLIESCRRDLDERTSGRSGTKRELLQADSAAFLPLPQRAFESRRVADGPVRLFSLDGRPHLACVHVETTPVAAYQSLLSEVVT